MPTLKSIMDKFRSIKILPPLLVAGAFIFFASQLWVNGQNQISVLDEGLYLFKGLLFTSGKYTPFQDLGLWTNQMPFAFLIPGWVQQIFGPGLRTGRFFAFALSILTFWGLWATSLRLSNRWVAALVIILFAINPATTKIYSVSTSQPLTSFLLIFFLFFTLDHDRKNWQIFLGGVLAGLIVMVRINMMPILPIALLYIYWERGWQSALWYLAGVAVFFGGGHIAYWPNILKIWAGWLPFPFLNTWFPPNNISTWNPDNLLGFRVASFFLAFRFHFAALVGTIVALSLLNKEKLKQNKTAKSVIFLTLLLAVFFLIHLWASLLNNYCVFCFPTYTAFYSILGLLILAITLPTWNLNNSIWASLLGLVLSFLLLLGITYSAEDSYRMLFGEDFYKDVLNLKLTFLGKIQLWQIFANKFTLDKADLLKYFYTWLPVVFVFVLLLLIILATLFICLKYKRSFSQAISLILLIVFTIGCALSPSSLFSGYYNTYDCGIPLVQSYEKAGAELSAIIPKDSKLYWVGYSPVTLTYLPDVEIYPAQLHGGYSYRISQDDNALESYGWWNESLAKKWLTQADYILAQGNNIEKVDQLIDTNTMYEIIYTSQPQTCEPSSMLYLYRRK